jgi:two-component system, chemotaxis family, sensor kinase Cph1
MRQLVDGLLSFARLAHCERQDVSLDLEVMVRAVIEEQALEAGDRSIRWEVGRLPRVLGDPPMLHVLLQNLLGNAVKFTRGRAEAIVEIGAVEAGPGEAGFRVRDNGAGFDPAQAGRLFGVFQRLHHREAFEGTGIGLASVQRIVVRHGGRVRAEGRPGQGATFEVILPAAPA